MGLQLEDWCESTQAFGVDIKALAFATSRFL